MSSSTPLEAEPSVSSPRARPGRGKRNTTVRAFLALDGTVTQHNPDGTTLRLAPRTDWSRADAVTEAGATRHAAEDEAEARRDAAEYARSRLV